MAASFHDPFSDAQGSHRGGRPRRTRRAGRRLRSRSRTSGSCGARASFPPSSWRGSSCSFCSAPGWSAVPPDRLHHADQRQAGRCHDHHRPLLRLHARHVRGADLRHIADLLGLRGMDRHAASASRSPTRPTSGIVYVITRNGRSGGLLFINRDQIPVLASGRESPASPMSAPSSPWRPRSGTPSRFPA